MRLWRRKPKVSDGSTVAESFRKRGLKGGRRLRSAEGPILFSAAGPTPTEAENG